MLACIQGNLYNSKTCPKSDLIAQKIILKLNNPYNLLMESGNFIVSEYNLETIK
ncbi:hypothetical protein EV145_102317 [Flavobacterium sp. 245]|nr:hypothetical protein EV145_102317 [Flavobacterium sp. 245]